MYHQCIECYTTSLNIKYFLCNSNCLLLIGETMEENRGNHTDSMHHISYNHCTSAVVLYKFTEKYIFNSTTPIFPGFPKKILRNFYFNLKRNENKMKSGI